MALETLGLLSRHSPLEILDAPPSMTQLSQGSGTLYQTLFQEPGWVPAA